MLIKEFKYFCNEVWSEDYNCITTDLSKKKKNGKIRQTLKTIFIHYSNPLKLSNPFIINMDIKKCTNCNVAKPFSELSKHSKSNDKLHYYCKRCDG